MSEQRIESGREMEDGDDLRKRTADEQRGGSFERDPVTDAAIYELQRQGQPNRGEGVVILSDKQVERNSTAIGGIRESLKFPPQPGSKASEEQSRRLAAEQAAQSRAKREEKEARARIDELAGDESGSE